ncbi:hypothetical protein [Chondromyces crocatus]|uniref:Secreted protein n=1 Tax=Chondromyces crocatus TaxID=52 RepID=A0A0K1ECQ4_CHOCO|nr:hypothetical protein [Chondromyces crocatus]AKT38619.1 uncharacterized protein CMC5_027660 [Chondromyces crocatus]
MKRPRSPRHERLLLGLAAAAASLAALVSLQPTPFASADPSATTPPSAPREAPLAPDGTSPDAPARASLSSPSPDAPARASLSSPSPDGANPLGALERTPADGAPSTGRVEERITTGSYVYHAVRRDDGDLVWIVSLGAGHPTGTPVKLRSMGRRTDFRSNRLQRTFPELLFGIVSRRD